MRRIAIQIAAGMALLIPLGGCGGGDTPSQDSGGGVGPNVGAPINLADCRDWKQASVEERLGTISQIREFTGGPVAGTRGTGVVLEDQEAYDLFERYCANEFARAFKLYKLYGRAAAFQSYSDQAEGGTPAP